MTFVDPLHNTLVQKSLADIPAKAGNTRDGAGAREKSQFEKWFIPSKTAYIVEVKTMNVEINNTCRYKERELDQ